MKYILSLLIFLGLIACEAESDPNAAGARDSESCPSVGNLTVERSSGLGSGGRCLISGTLTETATLSAVSEWHLNGPLIIGDGASNPLFTIEPGVEIFAGENGSSFDYIYVAPGASISAIGTKNKPIILSSDDEDYEGSGQWGGLIIEDSSATSGQTRLKYVVVTEAGAEVTVGNTTYADNIVLEGVHDNTIIQYLQSHDSARDGIRLQSSEASANQARLSWLLITGSSRDAFSYNNFSGLVKDMLVIHRPEFYDGASGGRAGIYASNSNSLPLFVNITLAGRDTTSNNAITIENQEFGIVFADSSSGIRMANTLISNFRNGCYEVGDNADLSTMSLGEADITQSFIGGVHCGHERSGLAGNVFVPFLLRGSGQNIPGSVLNDGMQFHGNSAFNFDGEINPTTAITGAWFLNSIGGLQNDLVVNSTGGLNAFANGDTDDSDSVDGDDKDFQPLLNSTDAFFGGINVLSIPPEDDDPNIEGYDLTIIGAVRSASQNLANEFDGWTLQAGGIFPQEVTGFAP